MRLVRSAVLAARRLGVLPGTFNPPTRAHLALASAALARVDEVLFVLPSTLPHKNWEGVGFPDRLRLLELALQGEPRFSVGVSSGGLFIDIARECRAAYPAPLDLFFLCGRDAAERIAGWDYPDPGGFAPQLREYRLLVAPRGGHYLPPQDLREWIEPLDAGPASEGVSSTAVRERIARGEPWEHLVPEPITELVRELYPGP
jgi:nicotinate (nicotinamide) nucleotide adenylyltransferase